MLSIPTLNFLLFGVLYLIGLFWFYYRMYIETKHDEEKVRRQGGEFWDNRERYVDYHGNFYTTEKEENAA